MSVTCVIGFQNGSYDIIPGFGLQTIHHLSPCVWCSLAVPAEILLGSRGRHVAQTLRFSRFVMFLSSLNCFWIKSDLSLGCGTHVLSRPRFLSTGSAIGAPDPKSLHYYNVCCVHFSEYNHSLKLEIVHSD